MAYDNTGRCAYHLPPFGCTLVDGDADGPGLIELYGPKPARPTSVPPKTRPCAPTQLLNARPRGTPTGAKPSTEVRKRSANRSTWCERCATGIHVRCADDHAIGHGGDDCIVAYRAKDTAARSLLCLGCWATRRPYVDESDEDEIERGDQPERHPNRLGWRWPGRLEESLDTAARQQAGTRRSCRVGRRPHYRRRASRTPAQARSGSPRPQQRPAARRHPGATPASRRTSVRTMAPASRHVPPAPEPPPGSHTAPLPSPEPPPVQHPAPLPPPRPPPRLDTEESDDENWAPYHPSAPTATALVPATTTQAASFPQKPPPNPPEGTAPTDTASATAPSG